jgi:hypothetical protein
LVDHWNGTSWKVVASPKSGSRSQFTSISAVSGSDVWAAGSYNEAGFTWPLVDHWNGTSWKVLAPPKAPGSASQFTSVSALSGPDVWAAGSYTQGGVDWPFADELTPGAT